MPYIPPNERHRLFQVFSLSEKIETLGQLTYVIYVLCLEWLGRQGVNYANYASVMGALECCTTELYRKEVAGYEDEKELQNGEIGL